jgi:hypothetical protein
MNARGKHMSEKNNKNPDLMSDHELLAELVRMNRRRHTLGIILSVLGIALIVVVFAAGSIVLPRMMKSMEEISQLTEQGRESLESLDKINFDTLNQGIEDFAAVAKKLASWFGK